MKRRAVTIDDAAEERAGDIAARVTKAAKSHRTQRLAGDELRILKTCGWDIEATNLDADMGIMLCSSVKDLGGKVITFRLDQSPGYKREPWNDKWLAVQTRELLSKYMVILGWNHVGYDLPFLNTRLIDRKSV